MNKVNMGLLSLLLVVAFVFQSCEAIQNTNRAQRGGVIGAAGGAAVGAAISKNNRALGAIVGGVVGGAAGAIIGNKMDKQAEKIDQALPGAEVVRSEEGIQVILDEKSAVRFEYNKSSLTAEAQTNLDRVVNVFKEYPDTDILIVGHTDNVGSAAYNRPLSQQRAKAVRDYLVSKGVNSNRIRVEGVGFSEPRYSNDTADGRAGNRRVEFAITANEKMIQDAEREAQGQ
ncbi:MAG: OmpA family protein [Weeksellaceae bacterium]|nr:OmpA family protein [Weeksellaceae bacterium]